MRMRTAANAIVALALTGALALGGCGGDSEESGSGSEAGTESGSESGTEGAVAVSGKEFAFEPSELSVAADEEFTIAFTNTGTIEHDFTIDGFEDEKVIGPIGGDEATGTFELEAGTYEFYCSVSGHKEAGMTGTLTVE